MSKKKQESKTMTVGAKVTPSEHHRIVWLAGEKGTDVSSLLREMSITEALAERDRIKARQGIAA